MGGYVRAMGHYAVFKGRAPRGEFWWFTATLTLIGLVALIIDGAIVQQAQLEDSQEPGGIVTAIVVLVHLLPSFAVTVRRLHDTNRSGWLFLLNLVPLLNLILLVLMCLRGTPGPNRFGPDPLDVASVGHGGPPTWPRRACRWRGCYGHPSGTPEPRPARPHRRTRTPRPPAPGRAPQRGRVRGDEGRDSRAEP